MRKSGTSNHGNKGSDLAGLDQNFEARSIYLLKKPYNFNIFGLVL